MRLPFFLSLIILVLYFRPFILTKLRVIIPLVFSSTLLLILMQLYRYNVSLSNFQFDFDFINSSFQQVNDILGATNELLMGAVYVKSNNIDIGFTSPFYNIIGLYELLLQKILNEPPLTMLERANAGSFSYQTFRYFETYNFYWGTTAGGSSLADVFYFWVLEFRYSADFVFYL